MRKVRPQDVKNDFAALVDERIEHFDRLEERLLGTTHEKRDLSLLSETTLHAIYVAFECFLSDLFLAYISRDFSQYQQSLGARMRANARGKFGGWAAGRMSFNTIRHIKIDDLEVALDPKRRNITFADVADLKQQASDMIAAPHRNGILAISAVDTRLVDGVHAIRNFIAHQSPNSKLLMNNALGTIAHGPNCPNILLARGANAVHDVGSYLKSVGDGQRRVKRIAQRLRDVSAGL